MQYLALTTRDILPYRLDNTMVTKKIEKISIQLVMVGSKSKQTKTIGIIAEKRHPSFFSSNRVSTKNHIKMYLPASYYSCLSTF